MFINGWDLVISRDGIASLWLYCEQPGNRTPRAVPVGPLPAADGRRLADWLCRSGPVDSEDVLRRVQHTGSIPKGT